MKKNNEEIKELVKEVRRIGKLLYLQFLVMQYGIELFKEGK